ncbi:MAG TPA: di-trans,poly-cis-decaprenylcistransferase [Candidatus Caccovivens faecavium]|nr:di-trans,poly-cis-decaprenylcistransferase [Candidatus Caccovivens faecavium]
MKKLPTHIAFIMDGNRRWAKKRGLNKMLGHKKGAEVLVSVIKELNKINEIKYASFFAFSTENWNREQKEIDAIFHLIEEMFEKNEQEFNNLNIKFVVMGDISRFPVVMQEKLIKVQENSKNNSGLTVLLALNYGGRDDIAQAVNKLLKANFKSVTEEDIKRNLLSYPAPDIDFLIRTSGEQRVSNFMLFQLAYSEMYFPKYCWPALTKKRLYKALKIYSKRNRRFGGN